MPRRRPHLIQHLRCFPGGEKFPDGDSSIGSGANNGWLDSACGGGRTVPRQIDCPHAAMFVSAIQQFVRKLRDRAASEGGLGVAAARHPLERDYQLWRNHPRN